MYSSCQHGAKRLHAEIEHHQFGVQAQRIPGKEGRVDKDNQVYLEATGPDTETGKFERTLTIDYIGSAKEPQG